MDPQDELAAAEEKRLRTNIDAAMTGPHERLVNDLARTVAVVGRDATGRWFAVLPTDAGVELLGFFDSQRKAKRAARQAGARGEAWG